MKTSQEVSDDKLRGGFYTPDSLVHRCIERVVELSQGRHNLSVLEPSVGDGAFLQQLIHHGLAERIEKFVGVEIIEEEAVQCRQVARQAPFETAILNMSVLDWAFANEDSFDVVVGNPPFVRFQFVSKHDVIATSRLGQQIGVSFRGVGNLWIPVLLGALSKLSLGGVMALVVPAELFTGLAAGTARLWLLDHFCDLRIDMFEPGSFPDVLQEIVVISGKRAALESQTSRESSVEFVEHTGAGSTACWRHSMRHTAESWTRYLLTPAQLRGLAEIRSLPHMQKFGAVAKLEVSIVTGANDYFSVTAAECERFCLDPWATPLLPRIRHAEGLIYTEADHKAIVDSDAKAWLLNFSEHHADPLLTPAAAHYIEIGKKQKLDTRYKTSIRTPWYRVPSIWAGTLLLSKRSHWFPRLIYNQAQVLTTDTIYRGRMQPPFAGRELELVASFHNSLTLLTAEIEGRSFGGGVLELVPSEIARLIVPFPTDLAGSLPRLDQISRSTSKDRNGQQLLIEATNHELSRQIAGLTPNLLNEMEQARQSLLQRRISRN